MAADLSRGCNEQLINNQLSITMFKQNPGLMSLSSEIYAGNSTMEPNQIDEGGSSYTLASEDSRYNYETRGPSATADSGIQNSSVGLFQRSTLARSRSMENTGLMYFLALLLPLVSAHNFDMQWRCTPSAVLRVTESFLIQLSRILRQARGYFQQLARDQIARDLFATAMDIVLVVYAIGFLFLSLYQASIFA